MKAVGVILLVGDARYATVALPVKPHKPSGQAFGRRGQQGKIHLFFLGDSIAEFTHVHDDVQASSCASSLRP